MPALAAARSSSATRAAPTAKGGGKGNANTPYGKNTATPHKVNQWGTYYQPHNLRIPEDHRPILIIRGSQDTAVANQIKQSNHHLYHFVSSEYSIHSHLH